MIEKVEAWKTSDGKLFMDRVQAESHQNKLDSLSNTEKILAEKSQWIKEYYHNLLEGDVELSELGEPYTEGEYAWDCEHEDNPINKCVYIYNPEWTDECCIFCGEPEERK